MPIPAYMWLKDDGGALIKGGVDVKDRDYTIEVKGFHHNLMIPTDNATGKVTGTRMHSPMLIVKDFDCSSPYLYKAVATGQKLQSAEIKWYRINDAGMEAEYFNMLLEGVRIVSISPAMATGNNLNENHMETVEMRYEKITWKHNDGNIIFTDSRNDRQTV
ncbi:Hcp family type VI secretion system effector [Citrobacter sedlakii]|uniref:Hcp family type VI secretion system effector n=1 Tax=Citrobacter sedlakii TaxID=67826 RepID=UPI0022B2BA39|nr:Hcp family type VI secretion system effector [Citrobacter sedlakii]MCZ4674495.1 Hcp family type VI secretion system effector [Citrobacter sedlakii]MDR5004550.1 Hcp family type VI secretion system effector [Citrobacter sedlakii]